MLDQFSRTRMQFGKEAIEHLKNSAVAVFGIGGVGGYTVEALARSGIGRIAICDDDKICITNLNRQIVATHKTVGMSKVEVMKARILEINPQVQVDTFPLFYGPETVAEVDLSPYDYIIDAVDTVTAKLALITQANTLGISVISAMGAANKLDPTAFVVADIFETKGDALARVMRRELRRRGVSSLKVVYSTEEAKEPVAEFSTDCKHNCVCPPDVTRTCTKRRQIPSSNAFVPAVSGLILAGEVIKDLAFGKTKG